MSLTTFDIYREGLRTLIANLGEQHPRIAEARIYQQRFLENIEDAKIHGDTDTLRAGRAKILANCDQLSQETTGKSFYAWCSLGTDQPQQITSPTLTQIQPVIPKPSPPDIPYPRDPHFVGRSTELKSMHQALQHNQVDGILYPVMLIGLGGVGKTQLAVEYAYRYQSAYPGGVYWVNAQAENWQKEIATTAEKVLPESTLVNAASMSESMRQRYLSREFADFLNARPDALLIFDDVADPRVLRTPQAGFIPTQLRCRVLLTTRRRSTTVQFIPLDVRTLPEQAALALLLSADSRQGLWSNVKASPASPEGHAARSICKSLGYLPLALAIAAAYLAKYSTISLVGYLERLEVEGKLQTIDAAQVDPLDLSIRHQVAVTATLQSQWDALRDDSARYVLQATALLGKLTHIPRIWLAWLCNLPDEARPGYPAPLEDALIELREFSLIEELTDHTIQVHPLVQAFALNIVAPGDLVTLRLALAHNAIHALQQFPDDSARLQTVGECLLALGWHELPKATAHTPVLNALRVVLRDRQRLEPERRAAAALLARLSWLLYAEAISAEELLDSLELLSIQSEDTTQHLNRVKSIAVQLKETLPSQERASLYIYRAGILAQLSQSMRDPYFLDAADEDYDAARRTVEQLIADEVCIPDCQKALARINLGSGNIALFRAEALVYQEADQQALLHQAIDLYQTAAQAAQAYGQDVILEKSPHHQLSYTYALLEDWEKAVNSYERALTILEEGKARVVDTAVYWQQYIQTLEGATDVQLKYGQHLLDEGNHTQSSTEYEKAYQFAQQCISKLREYFDETNVGLVYGYTNSGDSQLGKSKFLRDENPLLSQACGDWARALELTLQFPAKPLLNLLNERISTYCLGITSAPGKEE